MLLQITNYYYYYYELSEMYEAILMTSMKTPSTSNIFLTIFNAKYTAPMRNFLTYKIPTKPTIFFHIRTAYTIHNTHVPHMYYITHSRLVFICFPGVYVCYGRQASSIRHLIVKLYGETLTAV